MGSSDIWQFEVYNAVLRRFPAEIYTVFEAGKNFFPTTISVLVSAVQKLARAVRVPEGKALYRGLGGLLELPEHFFRADEKGCRGYTEWGLMSTTSCKAVALQYSGVRSGRPNPMVLVLSSSAIDRGACIHGFSQYPEVVLHPVRACDHVRPYNRPAVRGRVQGVRLRVACMHGFSQYPQMPLQASVCRSRLRHK
jgi:hypothetical protein